MGSIVLTKKKLFWIVVVGVALGVAMWTYLTHVPHQPYRVPNNRITTSIISIQQSTNSNSKLESYSVEAHVDFTLAFVEFDDQGDFWSRRQLDNVSTMIDTEAKRDSFQGLIILVFTHGWNHNASLCDTNVTCFRRVLENIGTIERLRAASVDKSPRRVVGIYIGWRGLTSYSSVLRHLSFYSRKATAHRIGSGQVIELLTSLEVARDRLNEEDAGDSRLVIIGHSFGAAIVYSALAKILHERLMRALTKATSSYIEPVKGFGDLVVLVNPAFEASMYSGISALAHGPHRFPESQPALMLTIASETDSATKQWFPLGRYLSTFLQHTTDVEQHRAITTALGNFDAYKTHRLGTLRDRLQSNRSSQYPGVSTKKGPPHDVGVATTDAECGCPHIRTAPLSFKERAEELRERLEYEFRLTRKFITGWYSDIPFDQYKAWPQFEGVYGKALLQPYNFCIDPNYPFLVAEAADNFITEHNGIYNEVFVDFLTQFLLRMERKRDARFIESARRQRRKSDCYSADPIDPANPIDSILNLSQGEDGD